MLEWLESQGHWGFITVSYAIATKPLSQSICPCIRFAANA
jgi:hypothetical protein